MVQQQHRKVQFAFIAPRRAARPRAARRAPGREGSGSDGRELLAQTSERLKWPHALPAAERRADEERAAGPAAWRGVDLRDALAGRGADDFGKAPTKMPSQRAAS